MNGQSSLYTMNCSYPWQTITESQINLCIVCLFIRFNKLYRIDIIDCEALTKNYYYSWIMIYEKKKSRKKQLTLSHKINTVSEWMNRKDPWIVEQSLFIPEKLFVKVHQKRRAEITFWAVEGAGPDLWKSND